MPKVTEEYIVNKKKRITDVAYELCLEKTVSTVTMQDIIDRTGFSQGGIYRFYKDIDDIFSDMIRQMRERVSIKEKIDEILGQKEILTPQGITDRLFAMLADFMESELMGIEKIDFELSVLAMNMPDRIEKISDKAYRNVTEKFRWGGLDSGKDIYLDETVRRMVSSTRMYILNLATALINEAVVAERVDSTGYTEAERRELAEFKADRYAKAAEVIELMEEKLPAKVAPYSAQVPQQIAGLYSRLALVTGNKEYAEKARTMLENELRFYTRNLLYYQSLSPSQYATLPLTDRYIEVYYIITLLQDLADAGGDAEAIVREMEAAGVDFSRITAALENQ